MTAIGIKADPTFNDVVQIPRTGLPAAEVRFTFQHRTQEELDALIKGDQPVEGQPATPKSDEDIVLRLATGWELTEAFTRENVRTFCQNFHGAAPSIVRTYLRAYAKARLGN